MDLKWLAAAIFPANIAPHPNLIRTETIDQPSLFALVTQLKTDDFDRLTGAWPLPTDVEPIAAHPITQELSRLVRSDPDEESIRSVHDAVTTGDFEDVAHLAASALLVAALWSEADNDRSAIDILEYAIGRVRAEASNGAQLVEACLLQQQARRTWDLGESVGFEQARAALSLVESIEVLSLTVFSQSRGTADDSISTLSSIIDAVRDSARAHLLHEDANTRSEDEWLERVRRRAPYLSLRAEARMSGGYSSWFGAEFDRQISGADSTRRDQGQAPLGAALLHYEILGAPEVVDTRRELASFYFILSNSERDIKDSLLAAAVRLIRRGSDRRTLNELLRHLRTNGPAEALKTEASRIISTRTVPNRLRIFEYSSLESSAEYLTREEARRAYHAVLDTVEASRVHTGGTWQADHIRIEGLWSAAIALAGPADEREDLGRRLLSHIEPQHEYEQIVDITYARLLDELPWRRFPEELLTSWNAWLDEAVSSGYPRAAEIVYPHLRSEYSRTISSAQELTLDDVVAHLNQRIRYDTEYPRDLLDASAKLVEQSMQKIRSDARSGRFSAGNYACAVAVGLAVYAKADGLWKSISAFLKDGNVTRQDKTDALERMAAEPDSVPAHVIYALSIDPELLLHSTRDVFNVNVDPFPPALRCLAALRILPDDELIARVSELSAASQAISRVEAGRTLTTIARRTDTPTWVFPLALNLSFDVDAGTRAEAARCLMRFSSGQGPQGDSARRRIGALLAESGNLVPTLVLRGLQEQGVGDSEGTAYVTDLALQHPSALVRDLASQIKARSL